MIRHRFNIFLLESNVIRKLKGQEAIEFTLITVLVFFGALTVVLVFGGKIADFFQKDSSVITSSTANVNTIEASSPQKFQPDYETHAENNIPTQSVGGYEVAMYPDGSAEIYVGEQQILLPSQAIDLSNIVFETSGSGGLEKVIADIVDLVSSAQAASPGTDIPLEIYFGTGQRSWNEGSAIYESNAEANLITLKVDDRIIVYQNDQTSSGLDGVKGIFKLDGNINASNQFVGKISGKNVGTTCPDTYITADYKADLDTSNGIKMNGYANNYYTDDMAQSWTYTWNLDFSNPDHVFNI